MAAPAQTGFGEGTTYILAITCEQMKDAEDHLHEYILAWLDIAMGDDKSAFDLNLGLLRTVQQVFTFNNGEKCFDYLSSIAEKRVFLVLSCTIDDQLSDRFLALPQLEYIYLFGEEAILKKEHSKLVEVTSIRNLYSRLSRDARSIIEEDDDTDFASLESNSTSAPIQGVEGDARIYVFYQFLIEILLRLPKTPDLKERFISFCMEKTNDNPAQQKIFQEFIENYKPDDAITWYTSPCFLHKLLNRTCRLGNIKDMFQLAFFMVDLNAQLKSLHTEYFDCYEDYVHVYRGRPMSKSEYEKLKASIGDLVVTKSFLSTTMEEDVARMYSGAGTPNATFVPAIIHMRIDKQRNETKPFAFTRYHSKVRADDEILISIGTIFRVVDAKIKNGVHEFVLVRGDAEEKLEREIKSAFRDQATTEDAFFHLDPSRDIDKCCKQVLETLTASGDQVLESLQGQISSKIVEKTDKESKPTIVTPVISRFLRPPLNKCIWNEIQTLKRDAILFILDIEPTADDSGDSDDTTLALSLSSGNIIIEGRILPTAKLYCRRSFRVRFTLTLCYPIDPPTFYFLDPMYHPNINTDGKICLPILNKHDSYNPALSLLDIIVHVDRLITVPNLNHVINIDVGVEYEENRSEFNRKARDFVLRYGRPRT